MPIPLMLSSSSFSRIGLMTLTAFALASLGVARAGSVEPVPAPAVVSGPESVQAALQSASQKAGEAALPPAVTPLTRPEPVQERLATTAPSSGHRFQADKIVINIPSRTLWVYENDRIVRFFPVGVGRVGFMTPVGHYKIIRKVLDPGWENPYQAAGKMKLAPGENNPLGTRWMGFYQNKMGEFGMHGTDNPASVGKYSSHGCVRMKVKDAEALFEMLEVGTPVEVTYQPVLIRRQGSHIRVIVFADRFRKGLPSLAEVKADILKQYPDAHIEESALQTALKTPAEKPVNVATTELPAEAPGVFLMAAPAQQAVLP